MPSTPRTNRSRIAGVAWSATRGARAAACALALLTGAAFGQATGSLDRAVVEQAVIAPGGAEETAIASYVSGLAGALTGTDRSAANDAIRQALEPLAGPARVSVAFRAAYSSAMISTIDAMLASEAEPWHPLTALRLCGALATEPALARIESALDRDEPQVRQFAAFAAEVLFTQIRAQQPALVESRVVDLVGTLGEIVETSSDPVLADTAARAVAAAGQIGRERLASVGAVARQALAERLGVRMRAVKDVRELDLPNLRAVLRGARDLRDGLVQARTEAPEVSKAAAGLAGDMIAFLDARVRAGAAATGDEQSFDAQFAGVAETLLESADRALAGATGGDRVFDKPLTLRENLVSANARAFTTEALAAEQRLSGPRSPYAFPEQRFVRE